MKNFRRTLDPVTFEVLRGGFEYICERMKKVLQRVSFSPIIYENRDLSVAVYDEDAELIGQTAGCPIHLGAMHHSAIAALTRFGKGGIKEGDVIIVNDPYTGGTHIPDVNCVSGMFFKGELMGYACARAHHTDLGGGGSGGQAWGTHVASEGFRMFPLKVVKEGTWNRELVDLIKNQSRTPGWLEGDLMAQVGAIRVAEEEMRRLTAKYGVKTVKKGMKELILYTESLFRQEILALPDGEYEAADFVETDGYSEEPIVVKVKLIVAGDKLTVDFGGTAPQTMGAINSPYANTYGAVYYAFACLLAPDIPMNGGVFKCVKVILPDKCFVNAKWPAPTIGCTTLTASKISAAIYQAFAKAVPKKAVGCTFGDCNWFVASIRDPATDVPVVIQELPCGGWGGTPKGDGINCTQDPLGMCENLSAEVAEATYPVYWDRTEMRMDSGGPGKHRGGLGMVMEFTTLGHMELSQETARTRIGTVGVNGGGRSLVQFCVKKEQNGKPEVLAGWDGAGFWHKSIISNVQFPAMTKYIFAATGGGGWGNPLERGTEKVLEDVIDGYVSIEGAKKDYGVVINQKAMKVDEGKTKALRKKLTSAKQHREQVQGIRMDNVPVVDGLKMRPPKKR